MADASNEPTLAELKERAADLEIEGRSSMNKEELAEAIRAAETQEEIPGVPAEVLKQAQDEAVARRDALRQAVDDGYTVEGTEVKDDGTYVLILSKEGTERRARLDDDGELRFSK